MSEAFLSQPIRDKVCGEAPALAFVMPELNKVNLKVSNCVYGIGGGKYILLYFSDLFELKKHFED